MAELKLIYLKENEISRIETLTFSSNPKLQMIDLAVVCTFANVFDDFLFRTTRLS